MNSSQQAYSEWKSAVQMREACEAEYVNALSLGNRTRIRECKAWWVEAKQYASEALQVYRKAQHVEKHPEQGVALL